MTIDATAWVLSRLGLANDASTTVEMMQDTLGFLDFDAIVQRRAFVHCDGLQDRWYVAIEYQGDGLRTPYYPEANGETALIAMTRCFPTLMLMLQEIDTAAEAEAEAIERADIIEEIDAWCAKADNEQEGE